MLQSIKKAFSMETVAVEDQAEPPPKLQIKGLNKSYDSNKKSVQALSGIDLDVRAGEFLVLVGPSGCGKSTLLSMIAGFEEPTEGTISLDGKKLSKPGPDRLLMFQEHALFPWLNVIDNICFGMRHKYNWSWRKCRKVAISYIRMVHLDGFERASIHELSGGMKHRVSLARSLAPDPEILLIDEPFPALDTLTKLHLYQELQEIFVSTKKTIISVTHDPLEAACLADRVIVFSSRPGKIEAENIIDLPRPRRTTDSDVVVHARHISDCLERFYQSS